MEWKLPRGGNSGVFYNVQEGYDAPYAISPEYQLLDDNGWEQINNQKLEEWQKAGANYAMHEPDLTKKKLNSFSIPYILLNSPLLSNFSNFKIKLAAYFVS